MNKITTRDYWAAHYRDDLNQKTWFKRAKQRAEFHYSTIQMNLIEPYIEIDGLTVLDVGSGTGEFCYSLSKKAEKVFGIEPGKTVFKLSKDLLKRTKTSNVEIVQGVGEKMPFDNGSMDLVTCCSVIEHVDNPFKVYSEIFRVLKKQGLLYLDFPQYASFYEHHYKVKWLPFFGKTLGSFYLKIIGKNPVFLRESVNFITFNESQRHLKRIGFVLVRDISLERKRAQMKNYSFFRKLLIESLIFLGLYPSTIKQIWGKI